MAPSNAAWIVAVPGVEPAVARPFEPAASLTVPLARFKDVHVANVVKTCDAPLARVPVAENCCVVRGAILAGADGDTVIDDTCDVVSVVVPEMPLETAVIVVVPMVAVAVARPREPAALLMVATPVFDESHVADVVMFTMLPSENVPVAISCTVVPGAMLESAGDTDRETSVTSVAGELEITSEEPVQPCRKAEKSTMIVVRVMLIHARHLLVMVPLRCCRHAVFILAVF